MEIIYVATFGFFALYINGRFIHNFYSEAAAIQYAEIYKIGIRRL